MKAIVRAQYGPPAVLRFAEIEKRALKDNEDVAVVGRGSVLLACALSLLVTRFEQSVRISTAERLLHPWKAVRDAQFLDLSRN